MERSRESGRIRGREDTRAKHQVVVSRAIRGVLRTRLTGTSKGHRDGEWKGGGGRGAIPPPRRRKREGERGRERDGGGRRTRRRLDASVSVPRYLFCRPPSRYLRVAEVSGMQRGNEAHERPREGRETDLSLYPELPRKEVSGNRCREIPDEHRSRRYIPRAANRYPKFLSFVYKR